jgi:phytoene dehydrogenase-like protein
MSAATFDAIVVGAGPNGLVAAAALGAAGRRVIVLERADAGGGQSRVIEFAPGFRAPLSTDAGWLPPSVVRGLGLSVPASTPPAASVSVAHDGSFLSLACDPRSASEAIRKYSTRDAGRWAPFVARLGKLAGFLGELYQRPAPDVDTTSFSDLGAMLGLGRKFRALGREDMTELLRVMPMSIQDLLDDEFESEALKAAVGAGGVRNIRQGPRSGGTSFVMLHYLIGAPAGSVRARAWWRDGPDALITALDALARRHGATIRTNAEVAQIIVKDDAVAGVELVTGEAISAPLVVSTADPQRTLRLVDPVWLDPDLMHAVQTIKYRGCTSVVHYAVSGLPSAHGLASAEWASVVTLTPSLDALERAYDAAKYGATSAEPHVEITAPSVRWPSLAPDGKHVVTARVQFTPYDLREGLWNNVSSRALGESVAAVIGRALPGFADRVLHMSVLTPRDIETTFALTDGALTQGEITLDQILFMRPAAGLGRHAMPVDGLYLGGAGAHPGPGIPGGAGWLAARAALSSPSSRKR